MNNLESWLKKFCEVFGLKYIVKITNVLTSKEVVAYSLVTSRDLEKEYISRWKSSFGQLKRWLYFKRTQSGVGTLEKNEVEYLNRLIKLANSSEQTNDPVVNYLRQDKELFKILKGVAEKIKKYNLVGYLPIFKDESFFTRCHEGIHHILYNNGLHYSWNAINEGLCVYLHLRFLEHQRIFHTKEGSDAELKEILKEIKIAKKYYSSKGGKYCEQIGWWAEYFAIAFKECPDNELIGRIRQISEADFLNDMKAYLGERFNPHGLLQQYKVD